MDPIAPLVTSPWWHHLFFRFAAQGSFIPSAYMVSAHRSTLAREPSDLHRFNESIETIARGVGTIDEWRQRLFVDLALTGNGVDYHDPRNSFLPDVLQRRLGIPITLAVVGLAVAERAGLISWGIGLPGHFLLGVAPPGAHSGDGRQDCAVVIDAFNGGRVMSTNDIRALFASMFGDRPFDERFLDPTPPPHIIIRMLNNLKANYARARDLDGLRDVLRMRTCIPGWSLDEGRELIRLLAATSLVDEATLTLDLLEERFPLHEEVLRDERSRLAIELN